jgi:DNA-binding protein H-NS
MNELVIKTIGLLALLEDIPEYKQAAIHCRLILSLGAVEKQPTQEVVKIEKPIPENVPIEEIVADQEVRTFLVDELNFDKDIIASLRADYSTRTLRDKMKIFYKQCERSMMPGTREFYLLLLQHNVKDEEEEKETRDIAATIIRLEQRKKQISEIENQLLNGESISKEEYEILPQPSRQGLRLDKNAPETRYYDPRTV